MLKKSLFFLVLLSVSVIASNYLNKYAKLNHKETNNQFVLANVAQNAILIPFNTEIDTENPEKVLAGTFTITAQESIVHVCNQNAGATATFTFDYTSTIDYDETTNFTITAASPEIASATFTFTPVTLTTGPTTFTLEISDIDLVPIGSYTFNVVGTGDGGIGHVETIPLTLEVDGFAVGPSIPSLPANGATNIPVTNITFTEIPGANTDYFTLQVSEDPTFPFPSLVIDKKITSGNSYLSLTTLKYSTVYYWRVKPQNHCDSGTWSPVQSFQTEIFVSNCTDNIGGINIPLPNITSTTDVIAVVPNITISDVNVTMDISHNFSGDLTLTLISPMGTRVILNDKTCGTQPEINVIFDDDASFDYDCFITTSARPIGSLADFNGEDSVGNWTLEIIDNDTDFSSGTLNSWTLNLCESLPGSSTNSVLSPHNDFNFIAGNAGSDIVPLHLEATSAGSSSAQQVFTLTQLPAYTLFKSGVAFTTVGQTFTQEDINNNLITYDNTASAIETDTFIVNITNATSGFLGNQTITINLQTNTSLGVDDEFFGKTGISVYPTVSDGNFNIRSNQYLGKTRVELYTITGLKVYTQEFDFNNNNVKQLEVPYLTTGIYILKLTTDTLEGSQKIIIR